MAKARLELFIEQTKAKQRHCAISRLGLEVRSTYYVLHHGKKSQAWGLAATGGGRGVCLPDFQGTE
ncbi:14490_t:CDS:2 [Dentiscutata erythropus]|uniref:14490_t:CDS:1 n=1 Tax=Dentiscutata erythropus TaxID=1348616 RepID=A0A9N9F2L7_9GLOM|nr:14490_t:CDS:2 [Dentiscutata erythropus]